ncbi:hypothetical protein F5887DRAFT_926184 [Amanita rubescens]|nr:hypothetical protein F5887DRAFT_926184 [Amanita rubescens]
MFFSRTFIFILFGVSVIAAPVHTHSSDKISPTDYGFWHKENGKDVLRIDGNHGGLTLELYKLEALTKGGNPKPEHVFITHGDKDHPILDPKENAALVVGDQWVRLSWKYVPAQYRVGGETGYDAHLSIKMGGDRALHMTIIDNPWED